jgi:NAD(P)-dependent dehydrogenase (short-subunit alcohol dehydrogenase family)
MLSAPGLSWDWAGGAGVIVMANVLSGRVGLVTGVSRDGQVGQAVAQALAAEGALLGIAARTRENVEARAEELRGKGARVLTVAANLADENEVRQMVDGVIAEYGSMARSRWSSPSFALAQSEKM